MYLPLCLSSPSYSRSFLFCVDFLKDPQVTLTIEAIFFCPQCGPPHVGRVGKRRHRSRKRWRERGSSEKKMERNILGFRFVLSVCRALATYFYVVCLCSHNNELILEERMFQKVYSLLILIYWLRVSRAEKTFFFCSMIILILLWVMPTLKDTRYI